MSDRGEHRSFFVAMADDPDVHAMSDRAWRVLTMLKLVLPATGIGVVYAAQLAEQCRCSLTQLETAIAELSAPKPGERLGWIVRERNILWIVNALRYEPSLTFENEKKHRPFVQRLVARLGDKPQIVRQFKAYYRPWFPLAAGQPEPAEDTVSDSLSEPYREPTDRVSIQWNGMEGNENDLSIPREEEQDGARGAPEPPTLALMRTGPPPTLPEPPAVPSPTASTALVPTSPTGRAARVRTKPLPRTVSDVSAAITRWIADTRAGGDRRHRVDEERRLMAGVVFVYWQSAWRKLDALLDDKREKLIVQRLRENGDKLDELLYAIDGGRSDPWVRDKRQGSLSSLLFDRATVEDMAGKCTGHKQRQPHPRAAALRQALAAELALDTAPVEVSHAQPA